jgi:hypothetical protein
MKVYRLAFDCEFYMREQTDAEGLYRSLEAAKSAANIVLGEFIFWRKEGDSYWWGNTSMFDRVSISAVEVR